jgi:hypothetical protein
VAAISAATSATVQTLLLIRAVQPVVNAAKSVEISAQSAARGVNTIETAIVSSKFVISSLRDGDTVTIDELVRGLTPFPGRMHYVVVTPVKAGDSYVQEEANVASDGTWTGHARFGSGDVGLNEKFIVRCVATREALHPGSSLASQPAGADAVFSSPITVLRTR